MGLHEPVWWAWPQQYERFDVLYMGVMIPLYCRKAKQFFPWSQFTIDENQNHLKLPFDNATVISAAPSDYFRYVDRTPSIGKGIWLETK